MSRGRKLVMVPTQQAYAEYRSWWEARKLAPPMPPNIGIFVAHGEYGLITGACVFNTDGPFALLEHFSVNPKLIRLWKPAAVTTLEHFRRIAVSMNKFPVICADRNSLARVCEAHGFAFTGARVMLHARLAL